MKNVPDPIRLLLIEDDDLTRELLAIQTTAEGYLVETAESGDAALLRLEKEPSSFPDVVLTDLQMPGICGSELAQRLRSLARSAGSPDRAILVMSASQPTDEVIESYDGFLAKPFTMGQLGAAIQLRGDGATVPSKNNSSNEELSSSPLDETVYQHLAASIPPEQLEQLYELFLDDVEARIARMRAAAARGDDAAYRQEAHSIKGGCGMVGAAELRLLGAAAEQSGIDSANHVASLDEFMRACGRLRRILVAQQTRALR